MKIIIIFVGMILLISVLLYGCTTTTYDKTPSDSFDWISEDSYYNDGKRQQTLKLVPEEIVIIFKIPMETEEARNKILEINPEIEITELSGATAWIKLPQDANPEIVAKELSNKFNALISPVFYGNKALIGELIIGFKEEVNENLLSNFESKYSLERIKGFRSSPKSYLFKAPSVVESLTIANRITESGEVEHAYPNFLQRVLLE
jgi:hypothetical protein